MEKMKKVFIVIFIVFSLTGSLNAQTTVVTTGVLLNELERIAQNILNDSRYTFNDVVNRAALNVLNAIQQFKDMYSDILDKTTNALTEQQLLAFNGLQNNVKEIFSNIEQLNDRIDNSVDNLALHLGHTLIGDKVPRITFFSSPIVIRGVGSDILISFKGVFLNNQKNYLLVNNKKFVPQEYTDLTLKFLLPVSEVFYNIAPSISIVNETIKLFCYYQDGVISKESKSKEYQYLIRSFPNKLGTIAYEYDIKNMVRMSRDRSESWRIDVKSGCCGSRGKGRRSEMVTPENGWQIDTNTIRVWWNGNSSCRNGSGYSDIANNSITSSGFIVEMWAATERHPYVWCHYVGNTTFQQFRHEPSIEGKKLDNINLNSKDELLFQLPSNTESWKHLTVSLFDGRTLIFTRPETKEFIKVDYNPSTKILTLQSKM